MARPDDFAALGDDGRGTVGHRRLAVGEPVAGLFWWGGCAAATGVVILFALYDALAVIREERAKGRPDRDGR